MSAKKDLEIVYNLQWKNGSGHGDDKANIVGMYDIPATTLNWETFKSYLLKNSGATGDDVKVSYVSIDDKEFPIESQLDFQIALYSFRQRARNGDIIRLKLDRIDTGKTLRPKRLRRLEEEKVSVENAATSSNSQTEGPPEWFKKYMKGFKKEIVEEVTTAVVNAVSNTKISNSMQPSCYHRKYKMDCCKRMRKAPPANMNEINDKEFVKSLKLERKLDCKLEKLEQKTQKIKERKLALGHASGDNDGLKNRPIGLPLSDTEFLMDASAIDHHMKVPHMLGGETFLQEWQVINTGEVPWTSNTELHYAWGSEALKPLEKVVACPNLNPGEKGIVSAYLEIPTKPGNYECYWHFYHKGRRFGHWLGFQIVVDSSPIKLLREEQAKLSLTKCNATLSAAKKLKMETLEDTAENKVNIHFISTTGMIVKPLNIAPNETEIENVGENLGNLKLDEPILISDANTTSDSDNQSIISIADSNSSINSAQSDEFVVIPVLQYPSTTEIKRDEPEITQNVCIPPCTNIKVEKIDGDEMKDDNDNNNNETKENIELNSELGNKNLELGFAYITYEGQKIAVPKCFLRADYLITAEEVPVPLDLTKIDKNEENLIDLPVHFSNDQKTENLSPSNEKIEQPETTPANLPTPIETPRTTPNTYSFPEFAPQNSHSMTDSTLWESTTSNKARLFVFPLNCPGFEVVYPPNTGANESVSLSSDHEPHGGCQNMPPCRMCSSSSVYYKDWKSFPENSTPYMWSPPSTTYTNNPNANEESPRMASSEYQSRSSSKEGSPTNENCTRRTLHCRFGNYMRHRSTSFNSANNWVPRNYANIPCASPHDNFITAPFWPPPPPPPPLPLYIPESQSEQPGNNRAEFRDRRLSTAHVLSDSFVSGAVNVASSAINTACSVLSMFSTPTVVPPPLHPPREQQVSPPRHQQVPTPRNEPENLSARQKALHTLWEMGFWDSDLNSVLLARYNDDLARVISELVQ